MNDALTIIGVATEKVGSPRNDGTKGSALYEVPLKLSATPSQVWRSLFVETWNHPPQFTTMHRPGIASVRGDYIVLNGTTINEVERYHLETLRHVLLKVNSECAVLEQRNVLAQERAVAEESQHRGHVIEVASGLRF